MRTQQGVTGGNAGKRMGVRAVLSLFLVLLVLVPLVITTGAAADENEGLSDLSLYQRTSELTREFGTRLAPGSTSSLEMVAGDSASDKLTAGNAGGLLGYIDSMSDDQGVLGWLTSSYTASSSTITYDQLLNVIPTTNNISAGFQNPFYQYAGYGEALTSMGLATPLRGGGLLDSPGRLFGTGLMLIVYLFALVAPLLFGLALKILETFNPFLLFSTVFDGVAASELGMLSGIAAYVGELYETVQSFSVAIILPLFLVVTILSIVFAKKGAALPKVGRYALQVFFLFAGLPLIGATYTGTVENLGAKTQVGSDYANYLVLSSYVDFEGWVRTSRLAPPSENRIRNPRLASEDKKESMSLADRSLVLEINGKRAGSATANVLANRYNSSSNLSAIFEEGSTGMRDLKSSSKASTAEMDATRQTLNMLMRHISSARYSGAQYDGEIAGQIQRIRSNSSTPEKDESIIKMFSITSSEKRTWKQRSWFGDEGKDWMEPVDWDEAKGLFTPGAAENPTFQFAPYSQNIYNSGGLTFEAVSDGSGNALLGYKMASAIGSNGKTLDPIGTSTSTTMGGLSPLAMYNFLNTTFSDTGMVIYSSSKSSSDLVRDSYASVSFAGGGVSLLMRWLENIVVMASLATVSIMYAVMMVNTAFKNIPRILSGVFGTALGSIAMATKLLISTGVMIIQILGLIFFYTLSENILMTLLLNFNELTASATNFFPSGGIAFEFARGAITIIVTLIVTTFLIKNMRTFTEMMEEFISNSITRLMSAVDTSTGGKGLSVADMTGGRVGQDGKLTADARQSDERNGLIGGVNRILGDAHDIESRRERLAAETGKGERSTAEKIKARLGTASELGGAKANDTAKGLVGIDGKSYEREMAAQNEGVKSIGHGDATALGKKSTEDYDESMGVKTTPDGKVLDANGEVAMNEHGNAVDVDGNAIAPVTPLDMNGRSVVTNDDGAILDQDGGVYTDELGNAFRQDEKGRLVDENGAFVALDRDGVLKPLAEVPDNNGKPVSASKEAKRLDKLRHDATAYGDMRDQQGATHYGLDKDGNVVDPSGQALTARGADGKTSPVALDANGFMVDKAGNKLSANAVEGLVDERAYERVTDPTTGETNIRHKGDAAMKNLIDPNAPASSASALAMQVNRAQDVAARAEGRVQQLKEQGASPYAVQQAERAAVAMKQQAQQVQQRFDTAVQEGTLPANEPVTKTQVDAARRGVTEQKGKLAAAKAKVAELKTAGAPPQAVAKAERVLEATQQAAQQAFNRHSDTTTALATGRSVQEVAGARNRLERAESVFTSAQAAYTEAISSGAPAPVLAKKVDTMNRATQVLAAAQSNAARVEQPPAAVPAKVAKAETAFIAARQAKQTAERAVTTLERQNAPAPAIQAAKKEAAMANRKFQTASRAKDAVLAPRNWTPDVPTLRPEAQQSVSQSFATLASSGISSYGDYSREVAARTSTLQAKQANLKTQQQRYQKLDGNRPPQVMRQMRDQITALKRDVEAENATLQTLQQNAQGLLKNNSFKPIVATKPIRMDGTKVLNRMVTLQQTQATVDRLTTKASRGTLTPQETKQLASFKASATTIRRELTTAGIKDDVLKDTDSLTDGVRHFGQSWDAFLNGTSKEAE